VDVFGESPRTLGRDCHGVELPSLDPVAVLNKAEKPVVAGWAARLGHGVRHRQSNAGGMMHAIRTGITRGIPVCFWCIDFIQLHVISKILMYRVAQLLYVPIVFAVYKFNPEILTGSYFLALCVQNGVRIFWDTTKVQSYYYNGKLHLRFRLASRLMTLDDLVQFFSEYCAHTSHFWEANTVIGWSTSKMISRLIFLACNL